MGKKRFGKQWLTTVVCMAVLWPSSVQGADTIVQPDVTQAQSVRVSTSANGVVVVDIRRPDEEGLSHNRYENLQVGDRGVIFNNSNEMAKTQLGGFVVANPVLAGAEAKTILNEVIGPDLTEIRGAMEIAGPRANLVIANPNGIVVDNGSFINTDRAILTTGKLQWGESNFRGVEVDRGNILVTGQGLNATETEYLALLSQAQEVNANIWAQEVDLVSGRNRIDLEIEGPIRGINKLAAHTEVGVRIPAHGGIYANQITLIGTEAGLGVHTAGTLQAQKGRLLIHTDGTLSVEGKIQGQVDIKARKVQVSTDGMLSGKTLTMKVDTLTNRGRLYGDSITLKASRLENLGSNQESAPVIAARQDMYLGVGEIQNVEHALLRAERDLVIGKQVDSNGVVTEKSSAIWNQSARMEAGRNFTIQTTALHNENLHYTTRKEEVGREQRDEVAGAGNPERYSNWDKTIYPRGQVPSDVVARFNDESIHLSILGRGYEEWWRYQYERVIIADVVDTTDPGKIIAGADMKLSGEELINDKSTLIAGGRLEILENAVQNINPEGEKAYQDKGMATSFWRHHKKGKDTTGEHTAPYSIITDVKHIVPMAIYGDQQTEGIPEHPTTVPDSALYQITPDVTTGYFLETDPAYTNRERFLSSDYFLDLLQRDPHRMAKRLGDGYFERQRVNDQVMQLTGKRYLGGNVSDEAQFKALMDAGVVYAKSGRTAVGVALSQAEQAALETDIVWMEEQSVLLPNGTIVQALVPQLYLAKNHRKDGSQEAIISGSTVMIQVAETILNTGNIVATEEMSMRAKNVSNRGGQVEGETLDVQAAANIENIGGTLQADKTIRLTAGGAIHHVSKTARYGKGDNQGTSMARLASISLSGAGGQLSLRAGQDIVVDGALIEAKGEYSRIGLQAGRTISLGAVTKERTEKIQLDANNQRTTSHRTDIGSVLTSAGALSLIANQDVTGQAIAMAAATDMNIQARGSIFLSSGRSQVTLMEDHYHVGRTGGGGKQVNESHANYAEEIAVGNTLMANRIRMKSGAAITLFNTQAHALDSLQGKAGTDISIIAGMHSLSEKGETKERKRGILRHEATDTNYRHTKQMIEESRLSGKVVDMFAKGNISLAGSTVVGEQNVEFSAGGDVQLTPMQMLETYQAASRYKASGLSLSGLSLHIGKERLNMTDRSTQRIPVGSQVLSPQGEIAIKSDQNVHVVTSRVASDGDMRIQGESVTIKGTHQLELNTHTMNYEKQGLTLSLGGAIPTSIETAKNLSKQAAKRSDIKLAALEYGEGVKELRSAWKEVKAYQNLSTSNLWKEGTRLQEMGNFFTETGNQLKEGVYLGTQANSWVEKGKKLTAAGADKLSLAANEPVRKQAQDKKQDALVHLQIGIGTQRANKNSQREKKIYIGSEISSKTGTVAMEATQKGITVVGSTVTGSKVQIAAKQQVDVLAGTDVEIERGNSETKGWSLGANIGVTGFLGADVGMQSERGKDNFEKIAPVASHIKGRETNNIESESDITIRGSRLEGKTVTITTDRDLTIASVQDQERQSYMNKQGGVSISLDANGVFQGAGSHTNERQDGNYVSVKEQAGIFAGEGGFSVHVGKHTKLEGALLASEEQSGKSHLETNTLSIASIQNKTSYHGKVQQWGMGTEQATSWNPVGANISPSIPVKGYQESITHTAIEEGALIQIRKGSSQEIIRDTRNKVLILPVLFDEKRIKERQTLLNRLSKMGYTLIGDLAVSKQKQLLEKSQLAHERGDYKKEAEYLQEACKWQDGGIYKVALHGAWGAQLSSMAGYTGYAGAISTSGNELLHRYSGNVDDPSLHMITSYGLGYGIGYGDIGANLSAMATENNWLNHYDQMSLLKDINEIGTSARLDANYSLANKLGYYIALSNRTEPVADVLGINDGIDNTVVFPGTSLAWYFYPKQTLSDGIYRYALLKGIDKRTLDQYVEKHESYMTDAYLKNHYPKLNQDFLSMTSAIYNNMLNSRRGDHTAVNIGDSYADNGSKVIASDDGNNYAYVGGKFYYTTRKAQYKLEDLGDILADDGATVYSSEWNGRSFNYVFYNDTPYVTNHEVTKINPSKSFEELYSTMDPYKLASKNFDFLAGFVYGVDSSVNFEAGQNTIRVLYRREPYNPGNTDYYAGRVVGDLAGYLSGATMNAGGKKLPFVAGGVFVFEGANSKDLFVAGRLVSAGASLQVTGGAIATNSAVNLSKDLGYLFAKRKMNQGGKSVDPPRPLTEAEKFEKSLVHKAHTEQIGNIKEKFRAVADGKKWKEMKSRKYKGKIFSRPKPIYQDSDGYFYNADTQHGRIEKYNPRGDHVGEFDMDLRQTKPAVPGRSIFKK